MRHTSCVTPLTIVRGELETALLDNSLSKNVRETIYSLIEETENLSKIVQCLLSLSRLDAGRAQMERVRLDLADLVSTITDQMAPLADEKECHAKCTNGRGSGGGGRSSPAQASGGEPLG
jgi:two-component system, OmpR family, sensor histidine kinase VanS